MSQPVRDGEAGIALQLGQDHQHLPGGGEEEKRKQLTGQAEARMAELW